MQWLIPQRKIANREIKKNRQNHKSQTKRRQRYRTTHQNRRVEPNLWTYAHLTRRRNAQGEANDTDCSALGYLCRSYSHCSRCGSPAWTVLAPAPRRCNLFRGLEGSRSQEILCTKIRSGTRDVEAEF